jgi:hypothetical protein
MLLGLLGLLYSSVLIAMLMAGSLACYKVWIDLGRRLSVVGGRLRNANKARVLFWAAVILAALAVSVPIFKLPLYPPTAFDATFYHLPSAKAYAQSHGLVFTPYLRFAVFPHTNQMLFTVALLLYDDVLAQLVETLAMVILMVAIISFGLRHFSARAGLWGVALLISNPLAVWLGAVPYVDMMLMLFVTLNAAAFWNWAKTRERKWIALAGVFCGLAFTVKYTAGLFLIMFLLAALYLNLRERRLADAVTYGLVSFAVAFPWLARNFYYTRNPIYPFMYSFFGRLFGYGFMRPEYYIGMMGDMDAYGVEKSLRSLARLPWDLTFNQDLFFSEAPLAPYILYGVLIILFGAFLSRDIRRLGAVALFFTLFWFFSMQVTRYWVPALPFLGLAAAASIDRLLSWNRYVARFTSHPLIVLAVFAGLSYTGWAYASRTAIAMGRIPATQQQRDEYLSRHLPSYPAYKMLRELGKENYTIYTVQDENMNYYADGKFLGDYFGPARYALIEDKLDDGQALYDTLKSMGVDYFLVNNLRRNLKLGEGEGFNRHFKLIYTHANLLLYDLSDNPIKRVIGSELLSNPGFESVAGGWPASWGRAGNPIIDASGKRSYSGSVAVRCIGAENVLYQPVSIKEGETYVLSYTGKGVMDGETARLQVNWSDANGGFLTTSLQMIRLSQEWKRYEMAVTAPNRAAFAVVYASCHDKGSAWLDDFSFASLRVERAQ